MLHATLRESEWPKLANPKPEDQSGFCVGAVRIGLRAGIGQVTAKTRTPGYVMRRPKAVTAAPNVAVWFTKTNAS